jgi:hypothetical protein
LRQGRSGGRGRRWLRFASRVGNWCWTRLLQRCCALIQWSVRSLWGELLCLPVLRGSGLRGD